jgi:sugar phosphate isomerase/epimerase
MMASHSESGPDMRETTASLGRFGISTATLTGSLGEKLRAARDAGFTAVSLAARDLVAHPDGVDAAAALIGASGLRIAAFQSLRDFEGLPTHLRDYKLEVTKSLLDLMDRVDARLLLVSSSMSPNAVGDIQRIADDLSLLGTLATPRGIRIAYEPLAWARFVNDYDTAWRAVTLAGRENVGLAVDSFHVLARSTAPEFFDAIPGERIFIVQLSDYLWDLDDIVETARHHRVFPSEGNHGAIIARLIQGIVRAGYAGDFTFDVTNDDYSHLPAAAVAARARNAALWAIDSMREAGTSAK